MGVADTAFILGIVGAAAAVIMIGRFLCQKWYLKSPKTLSFANALHFAFVGTKARPKNTMDQRKFQRLQNYLGYNQKRYQMQKLSFSTFRRWDDDCYRFWLPSLNPRRTPRSIPCTHTQSTRATIHTCLRSLKKAEETNWKLYQRNTPERMPLVALNLRSLQNDKGLGAQKLDFFFGLQQLPPSLPRLNLPFCQSASVCISLKMVLAPLYTSVCAHQTYFDQAWLACCFYKPASTSFRIYVRIVHESGIAATVLLAGIK